jgi:hypothetical protein
LSRHDWILLAGLMMAAAIAFTMQYVWGAVSHEEGLVLQLTAPAQNDAAGTESVVPASMEGILIEETTAAALDGTSFTELEAAGKERYWQIRGAQGMLILHFAPGHGIEIAKVNCPDQICVRTGFIQKAGQSVVCVPNEVIVSLRSADQSIEKEDVDAILQ